MAPMGDHPTKPKACKSPNWRAGGGMEASVLGSEEIADIRLSETEEGSAETILSEGVVEAVDSGGEVVRLEVDFEENQKFLRVLGVNRGGARLEAKLNGTVDNLLPTTAKTGGLPELH